MQRDFLGGPVAKTALPMQGSWFKPRHRTRSYMTVTKSLHATTKTRCSQINKYF